MKKWQGIALLVTILVIAALLGLHLNDYLGESGDWLLAVALVVGTLVVASEENLTGRITLGVFGLLLLVAGVWLGYRQYVQGWTLWGSVMAAFLVLIGLARIVSAFTTSAHASETKTD